MKLLSRLMVVAVLAPLAGCAVADLAAHAVKEYDRPREPVQPVVAQPVQRPTLQPAALRQPESDAPVILQTEPAAVRESVRMEALK